MVNFNETLVVLPDSLVEKIGVILLGMLFWKPLRLSIIEYFSRRPLFRINVVDADLRNGNSDEFYNGIPWTTNLGVDSNK
jgi:hypothetical protein